MRADSVRTVPGRTVRERTVPVRIEPVRIEPVRIEPVRIEQVAVIVPANDEERLLPRCLDSLDRAISSLDRVVDVQVIVVLDQCVDGSAAVVAGRAGVRAIEVSYRNVGAARHAGAALAIETTGASGPSALWLAHTDADSEVPPNWIDEQLDLASRGTELMIGAVRPDPRDLTPGQIDEWYRLDQADRRVHVHGANLGCRADAYLAAGGFPRHPEHEDVVLVDRMMLGGAAIVATDSCTVTTSGRRVGRTPGGFAAHVRALFDGALELPPRPDPAARKGAR